MGATLKKIGDDERSDHFHLTQDHHCRFLFEYKAGDRTDPGYSRIGNLKKEPSRKKNPMEWRYKTAEIQRCVQELRQALGSEFLSSTTWVPIPPSKLKSHREYDDRLMQILTGLSVDIREVVLQIADTEPVHDGSASRHPDKLLENYKVDTDRLNPTPEAIVIFDDMLTTGGHFNAVQRLLEVYYPKVPIEGIFIARRIFPEPPPLEFQFLN